MVIERIERAFGRRERLDVEALEQRAGAEFRPLQGIGDGVVVKVRRFRIQPDVDPEAFGEHPVEPDARGRAAEQMIALGKQAPRRARIGAGVADPEGLQPHALRIEHAEQVMVGHQQQLAGVSPWRVGGEPRRVAMPVRTDDRQVSDAVVQFAREPTCGGFGRQQPVGMELELAGQGQVLSLLVFSRTVAQW